MTPTTTPTSAGCSGRWRRPPVEGAWPLWGRDTATLSQAFLDAGFGATVVCVDDDALGRSFAGRRYDRDFLADLPDGVDPCGENGEFHTFVHDGPPFARPVAVERGERVTREVKGATLHYCDLFPGDLGRACERE
jgi:diphthamide synthase (EF-2-diphthine--ammonia ligase)